MICLNDAITIVRHKFEDLSITEYMETETSYIFPVVTPGAPCETTFFYEVNKCTGEHQIYDFWANILFNPDCDLDTEKVYKIKYSD